MALAACLAVAIGRGAGSRARVAAFSLASVTSSSRVAGRAFGTAAGGSASICQRSNQGPLAFFRRSASKSACGAITALQQSAVATDELEKTMDVTHPAFEVVTKDVVTEYGAYCTLYRHKKSGAELLSVATEDENKVFGITFRTPPSDSTGVPHILEHSVLCGSRKYKTKDPFVQLLQGSLQTFLNAFTYPDRTCYVVASQNTKDFYNLINVYADAVYHPRAVSDPMVHAQEGWHLELEDKDEPLTYKGVVYNEMKGVYSSPDSLLMRQSQRSLFPDNTYAVDSGGDPAVIPDLSFEQFADFHSKFYHPANSRIYFSGDDDVLTRLEIMDEYLSEFDASPESKPGSVIDWQEKKFNEPQWSRHSYPAGADQPETHMVNVNWLLNDKPMTATEELTLGILDHLLMGTTSSILRKTLMESGLGAAITGGGLSDELLQATFSVGLKGVEPDNVVGVEDLIIETLTKAAEEGFDEEAIASSMNTIEFQMREFNTGSFPRGLSFMLGAMSKWLYEESPTGGLKFEEPLAELKKKIEEGGSKVFQDMIKEYILSNTHRTTIELVPSKTLEAEQLKDEQDRLSNIKASLSDKELDEIMTKTKTLKELQAAEDSPEARATIPSLELSDLKREVTEYPIAVKENENESGVTVVRHELGSTSGIAYVNFGVDLSALSLDDAPLLSLFTRMMMETGAGEYSDVQLSRRIGTHTGGVSASIFTTPVKGGDADMSAVSDGSKMITKLFIGGKATSDKADELFSLFKLVLTDAKFDSKSKVIEMLRESRTRIESSIQSSGHSYSNSRLGSRYSAGGYISEKMGGITYLATVKELLHQAENDWPTLLARLENMRSTILEESTCRDGMILDITGDSKVLETIQPSIDAFLESLPGVSNGQKLQDFYTEKHPWVAQAEKEMVEAAPIVDEGFVVPTQVSYVGKGGLLFDEGESVPGASNVVSRFLRTGYLWDQVRVMGGAYGGFCTFDKNSGFFSFLSYRDPNLAKTIDVYDACGDALLATADELEKDPDALATAIIGAVGDMDPALSADQKGWLAFNRWIKRESSEYRQKYRDEVLGTTAEDFRAFAHRLKEMKKPSVAVVSSSAAFEAAAEVGKKMELKQVV
eukprot:CAMPEP_0183296302 /NCGR_PEP_ID=MMETSP0160_2-20130417/3918_1 /TAXON_ID=2839 ORGANISM="Odontella Sinensis, Strain Grunow 1884" /NCGR_SAMPLE_ID=MMETSP0160_2 /ASSEMBLY_ACC=CAM_ASM_000250 /LENGTH=1106 /DNA_ID=CAMNT_0025457905 /DNA_START=80 /DNA_END=3400 /DNA_ORIENTATION=+